MGVLNEVSHPAHLVLYVVIIVPPIILCFVLLCLLVHHFALHKNKIGIKLKIFAIAGIASFILTLTFYFVSDGFLYSVFWSHECYAMVSFFWGHGNASAYLLFVQRIKTVFGSTTYNPTKSIYTFFYISIFLVYLCQMWIVIFFLLLLDTDIDPQFALNNINIVNAFEIIVQLILSTSLIYVFVRKLNTVAVVFALLQEENTKHRNVARLLRIATKQTLLSSFAAITTCTWLIFAGIMDVDWIFYPNSAMNTKYALHFLTAIGIVLDSTVNSLAIFLSFSFADKYYTKLCSNCDRFCRARRQNKTQMHINMEQMEKQQSIQLTSDQKVEYRTEDLCEGGADHREDQSLI